MTKKDFELIAAALRGDATHLAADAEYQYGNMTRWEQGCYDQWNTTVLAIADALRRTNEKFDAARFLAACGVRS